MLAETTATAAMATSRKKYSPPSDVQQLSLSNVWDSVQPEEVLRAPPSFWLAGDAGLLELGRLRVAIVGSRDAGELGIRRARRLAAELSELGIVVVSGLAKGIDRAAHDGAMENGGRTIAVIGTPIDKAYPVEHAAIQQAIYTHHCLVSQFAPGSKVYPSNFVERNRFMALISNASVIVEAGDGSGTLSQAAETQRLGRHLFIMKNVLDNKSLSWPSKFLRPKTGRPAIILEHVDQLRDLLK